MQTRTLIVAAALAGLLAGAPAAGAAIPQGQLVANGGAEIGPVGDDVQIASWTKYDGESQFTARDFRSPGSVPNASGCRYFYGGEFSSNTHAYQDIDVSGAAAKIDGGSVPVHIAALLGAVRDTEDNDFAEVSFEFLDDSNTALDTLTFVGSDTATIPATGFEVFYDDAHTVPQLTRKIRVTMHASGGLNETSNNALIDNVGLTLDGSDADVAPPAGCNAPTGATGDATDVTADSATLSATFDPSNEKTQAKIEWGSQGTFGLTAANTEATGSGQRAISERITGLNPGQTYYYRVVVENDYGRVEGETKSFTTVAPPAPSTVGTIQPPPPPAKLGPFKPFLKVEKQRIAKIISSGFEVDLIGYAGHLAKSKIAFYVLEGRKRVKWVRWTDAGYFSGTGLSREPKGKLLRWFQRHRKVKIQIVWSSVTREGATAAGRTTVTVKR